MVTSILPYAGGKRTIAKDIVKQLGDHRSYWDVFCGGLGVVLAKKECKIEVVNDLNWNLTNLIHIIQSEVIGPTLYEKLYKTVYSEGLLKTAQNILKDKKVVSGISDLNVAYWYFVNSWFSANGFSGTTKEFDKWFSFRYKSDGGDSAIRFRSAVDNIPLWHKRLRNLTVLNQDGFKLLEKLEDKVGTVCYIDPPYIEKTFEYQHDFKKEDHEELANLVKRFKKTRVVISYYDCKEIDDLYDKKWNRFKIKVTKQLSTTTKSKTEELLLINGPIIK